MSHSARREYLKSILERYRGANKKAKGLILDEFCAVCGYSRKYAIGLLKRGHIPTTERRGRPAQYPASLLLPWIYFLWTKMGKMNSKRMKHALPEWLEHLHREDLTPEIRASLLAMSASTIERLLCGVRKKVSGISSTRPNRQFLSMIPIQPKDWNVVQPGTVQADTVAHTENSLEGRFAYTLTVTDIHTGWTENRAILGKGTVGMMDAISSIEKSLPFEITTFKSDSGSEFMNHRMLNYFKERSQKVNFVRSRPYRKNDNCYVEQKNFTHVRELFGYSRIDGEEMITWMNRIYTELWNPLANLFMPSTKLLRKTRIGSKIKKEYDQPRTPYQRYIDSTGVPEIRKEELRRMKANLDPWDLSERLDRELKAFHQTLRQTASRAA